MDTITSLAPFLGTVVTVALAAFHLNGRIAAIEIKVDLLMRGMIKRENRENAGN